jgi:hypothetical protein
MNALLYWYIAGIQGQNLYSYIDISLNAGEVKKQE